MFKKLNIYILLLLLNFVSISIYAQKLITVGEKSQLNFEKISTQHGLSQSSINCIFQDKLGFMWFGSMDGLNRFDGYEFIIYKPEFGNNKSISSNVIWDIIEDTTSNLFIGTNCGLNILNKNTGLFANYIHNSDNAKSISDNIVKTLLLDSKANIWVGTTNGLNLYDIRSRTFKRFIIEKDSIAIKKLNNIQSMCEDKDGNLWIGTDGVGVRKFITKDLHFDKKQEQSELYNLLKESMISSVNVDNQNNLWITTIKNGLIKYNIQTKEIQQFYDKPNNSVSIKSNNILTSYIDKAQNIWIGTKNHGLEMIMSNSNISENYRHNPFDDKSLSNNTINTIFEDRSGLLWIGTDGGGVNKAIHKKEKLKYLKIPYFAETSVQTNQKELLASNVITAFAEDKNRDLWIGTKGGGLSRMSRHINNNLQFVTYQNDYQSQTFINSNFVVSLFIDKSDNLWIGTSDNGLSKLVLSQNSNNLLGNEKFIHYKYNPDIDNGLSSNYVSSIVQDANGFMWFATMYGGLNKYNTESDKFVNYKHIPENSNSLSSNNIIQIVIDKQEIIWIATKKGLDKFNPQTEQFTCFNDKYTKDLSKPMSDINCIYDDNAGSLWLGTKSYGLNRFDKKSLQIDTESYLENYIIKGILADSNGELWISTDKNLIAFNPKNKKINYANDQIEEFCSRASYNLKSGEFVFGGVDGFNLFHPAKVSPEIYSPKVVITDFYLNNKRVQAGSFSDKYVLISKSISETKHLKLSYQDQIFSFKFAGLHYESPEKITYAYKLEGFDSVWIHTNSKNRIASYLNIPEGKYIFRVKACLNGVWNENGTKLKISISPPFWKTSTFTFIILLSTVILVYIFIKLRHKRAIVEKKIMEYAVRERTSEIASQKEEIKTQSEQIIIQNCELEQHHILLEKKVIARTKDLEEAKKRAEESDHMKTAFLTNMSHELRTPMNAIIGFSSLMDNPDLTNDDRKIFIDLIDKNSESLLQLMDDIIDVSKIESGDMVMVKENYNVNTILEELFQFFNKEKKDADKQHIDINLIKLIPQNKSISDEKSITENEINDKFAYIDIDPHRLRQVLMKLLSNALKYIDTGYIEFGCKFINVKVGTNNNSSHNSPYLLFHVKDTGIGMSEDRKKMIFDRFSKIDGHKSKLYRGAGLGLTISKNLVEMFGGALWVESEQDLGSTFFFTVPYIHKQEQIQYPLDNIVKEDKHDWDGKIILIAEDNDNDFIAIENILKRTNSIIIRTKNGKEAMDVFGRNNKINIVLMDTKMPVMNGYEATKQMKKMRKYIPVIAQLTLVHEAIEDKELITQAGFDDYILKPYVYENVLSILDKWIKNN